MQHEAILILNTTTVEAEFNVTVNNGEDMQRLCRIVAYYYLVEAIDNESNIYYYMKQNAMDAVAYWVSLQAIYMGVYQGISSSKLIETIAATLVLLSYIAFSVKMSVSSN